VRDHVRKRRRELGLMVGQVFVPQVHAPARTAEVDWAQAEVASYLRELLDPRDLARI
jgi:hypothetical protein